MANLQLIKEIADQKNISLSAIASELGITPQALSKIIRNNSTKIETLEKIADILKVSVKVFFPDVNETTGQYATASHHSNATNNTMSIVGDSKINISNEATRAQDWLDLLNKKDEQMDRLISVIEKLTAK